MQLRLQEEVKLDHFDYNIIQYQFQQPEVFFQSESFKPPQKVKSL